MNVTSSFVPASATAAPFAPMPASQFLPGAILQPVPRLLPRGTRLDGNGIAHKESARSARRAAERKARLDAKRKGVPYERPKRAAQAELPALPEVTTEPLTSAAARPAQGILAQLMDWISWALQPGPQPAVAPGRSEAPQEAHLTKAEFKSALAAHFSFEDFSPEGDNRVPRLVVLLNTDHQSKYVKQTIRRGVELLALGEGDSLLSELVDAQVYEDKAKMDAIYCFGAPKLACRYFREPPETQPALDAELAFGEAFKEDVFWLAEHAPDYTMSSVPDGFREAMGVLYKGFDHLVGRNPKMYKEAKRRFERLAALYDRSTALAAQSRRARDPAYLAQIKEAIGRGGRVAIVIGAGHLRRDEQLPIDLHDELRKLGALIGTPRRVLPDEL